MSDYFVPQKSIREYLAENNLLGVHHLIRYKWAVAVLKDMQPKTLIDIACGAGYGSKMIAQALPDSQIIGADYDLNAINYARSAYQAPNLRFILGDLMKWDLGDYDCIISFDTLEHIPHREITLENIVNHCGFMLFSTPCGAPKINFSPDWSAHKIEYNADSLYRFLSRYFKRVIHPELDSFPHKSIFEGIPYLLKMNPLLCLDPSCSCGYSPS